LARITQPASLAGNIEFALAEFGGLLDMPLDLQGILSQPNEGCSALTNAAAVAGKIAILDRGTCLMDEKCLRAQQAGAALVIVINNRVGPPFPMPAANVANQITVPCIMVYSSRRQPYQGGYQWRIRSMVFYWSDSSTKCGLESE
jgi:hypothetical protein